MPEYFNLSFWQVAIATSLILVSCAISLALQLGLGQRLLVASIRTVVQLLLVGLILEWVFTLDRWYVVLSIIALMTITAGISSVRRTEHRYKGIWADSVISMWTSSWLVGAVAMMAVIQVQQRGHPWYDPQYSIPLLGMILGNTLNGISLGLDRFGDELATKREQVETLLALGATRWEAARASIQTAVRTGMIPTLNTMMVVGIVSLPGMMTGQIIAGMAPTQAVLYQIVIMFLIAAGTSIGTVSVVLLGYFRLFNAQHQFLPDKLVNKNERGRRKGES
jgi:putative ABC transport system permease protein